MTTIGISGFFIKPHHSENVVIRTKSAGNQRRYKSSLVGTSETTRATTCNKRFFQWLGGVIDGDGSFQLSKKGYTSLEITMGLEDLPCLRFIQNDYYILKEYR